MLKGETTMSLQETGARAFDTRDGFVEYLSGQLRGGPDGDEFRRALAEEVAAQFVTFDDSEPRPRRQRGMIVRSRRWVIRNDDLNLLKSVSDGLMSAAAATFFVGLDPLTGAKTALTALIGIGVSLVQLVRQVRRKGATLSDAGVNILCVLKARQAGMAVGELTKALNEGGEKISKVWTEEEVRKELRRLEKVPLRDGSVVALAAPDADGFWTASGV